MVYQPPSVNFVVVTLFYQTAIDHAIFMNEFAKLIIRHHRLTEQTKGGVRAEFSYDKEGNLLGDGEISEKGQTADDKINQDRNMKLLDNDEKPRGTVLEKRA